MRFPKESIMSLDFSLHVEGEVPRSIIGENPPDYTVVHVERGSAHRWYIDYYITFVFQGKYYQVHYMHPASESQDGQDRWDFLYDRSEDVELPEVFRCVKMVEQVTYSEVS